VELSSCCETVLSRNGVHLHVVQAGPPEGPLVILLHGFPEFWYGWRNQIEFLARLGYRVWAPDQRAIIRATSRQGSAPIGSISLRRILSD